LEPSLSGIDYGYLERESTFPGITASNGFRNGSNITRDVKRLSKLYDPKTAQTLLSNQLNANPELFEALMGWPLNWTSLSPLKELHIVNWELKDILKIKPLAKVEYQVERIKSIGNGQVPICVYTLLKHFIGDL
jgi:hypothetical protein